MPAYFAGPAPDLSIAVLAQIKNEIPVQTSQNRTHEPVWLLLFRGGIVLGWVRALVVLQKIESPGCEELCILLFVPITPRVSPAVERPRRTVNACLQPFLVHVVGEALHIGKPIAGVEVPLSVASGRTPRRFGRLDVPALVDVDIGIAVVGQAGGDHGVGLRPDVMVIHRSH